ncbi:MAG: hypothetical protein U0271_35790 [Polyangiaceae bacterium]
MSRAPLPCFVALGAVLVAFGCGPTRGPASGDSQATASSTTVATSTASAATGEPAASSATAAVTGRGVRLRGVRGASGSAIAIVVENGGGAPVGLRRHLDVERASAGGWSRVTEIGDIWLRESCADHNGVMFWEGGADECVELRPSQRYDSAPWMGTIGDAQCACEECGPAPHGRYRFVAHECDGATVLGEPFDL